MRIYTRKGDGGETGILRGPRLSKAHPRIRALGGLDELNAALGLVLAESGLPAELPAVLGRIQSALLEAGAALAAPDAGGAADYFRAETAWLESELDRLESELPPLRQFILPGGDRSGAALHWARTVARRAESGIVEVLAGGSCVEAGTAVLAYMNRLSDALFQFARAANAARGTPEQTWTSRGLLRGEGKKEAGEE
jgi:cob(I)alamin adenosyltransferase